jgi:hypothetical protein
MPTAVSPNHSSQSPSGHYDSEAGQCVGPTAAPPRSSSAAPPASTGGQEPSPAAVDQLVKAASARKHSSCELPVTEAVLSCAGAAVTILAGSATGVGAVAGAAILGAMCGVKVLSAEECLRQP